MSRKVNFINAPSDRLLVVKEVRMISEVPRFEVETA